MPITDTYTMTIAINQYAIAQIVLPVTYPASVDENTPFDITYTIKNIGTITGDIYAVLKVDGTQVPGSYWTQSVAPNGTVTKTFTHPGIAVATTFMLEAGRL